MTERNPIAPATRAARRRQAVVDTVRRHASIVHDGRRWAQVAVLALAAPWIRRALTSAEAEGLFIRGGAGTPGGRHVLLARTAPTSAEP